MQLKKRGRTVLAGLAAGVLVGGIVAAVTPAGAVVKEAAAAAVKLGQRLEDRDQATG